MSRSVAANATHSRSALADDVDTYYRLWHVPSIEWHLPLLADAYEQDLEAHGEVLHTLSTELKSLAAYWIVTVPDGETKSTTIENRSFEVPLLVHLINSAEAVESGIRLALAIGGYLTISQSESGQDNRASLIRDSHFPRVPDQPPGTPMCSVGGCLRKATRLPTDDRQVARIRPGCSFLCRYDLCTRRTSRRSDDARW